MFAEGDIQAPPTTGTGHDVLVALIYVGGPLLGILIPLVVTAWRGRRRHAPTPDAPPGALNSDTNIDDEEDVLRKRVAVLERFLFLNHMDPNRIRKGTEPMDRVHFD